MVAELQIENYRLYLPSLVYRKYFFQRENENLQAGMASLYKLCTFCLLGSYFLSKSCFNFLHCNALKYFVYLLDLSPIF